MSTEIYPSTELIPERGFSPAILKYIKENNLTKEESQGLAYAVTYYSPDSILQYLKTNYHSYYMSFLTGKNETLGFLIGQIMKATKGHVDPTFVKDIILKDKEEFKTAHMYEACKVSSCQNKIDTEAYEYQKGLCYDHSVMINKQYEGEGFYLPQEIIDQFIKKTV